MQIEHREHAPLERLSELHDGRDFRVERLGVDGGPGQGQRFTQRFTQRQMQSRLKGLVRGTLRTIRVVIEQ